MQLIYAALHGKYCRERKEPAMFVWNWIKKAFEIFDDALKFRDECLRNERFKHLGR